MQITFDPRDPNACASVLAMIGALHPELDSRPVISGTIETTLDAAAAFDSPSPEAAFPPVPAAPTVAPAIPVTSAPAGTPENGTAPTAPPVGSDNGPAAPIPASPSSGVELDADGLPWDGRIHSGPADKRPKNADGRWRSKRGVDDATVASVTAELRQVMGAPAPSPTPAAAEPAPASPPPAPVATAPTPAPAAPPPTPAAVDTASGPAVATTANETPGNAPVASPAPGTAGATTPTPPPAPSPAAAVSTFADLMKKVTRMQTAGLVTVEQTSQIAQSLGLTGLRDLMNRPDLVGAFDALLPDEAA